MRIEPINEHIGAIVEVERSRLGDPDVARAAEAALEKHGVLVFPKIGVTDEEQLRFTDSLGGRVDIGKQVDGGKGGTPNVYRVTLDPKLNSQAEFVHGTYFWHMDGLTVNDQPPKATMLSGRRLAATGGDTHFCSTYAAHALLPDTMKAEIEHLRVLHNQVECMSLIVEAPTEEELARWGTYPINEYPLVWTHRDGRKSLVMGFTAHRIAGMGLAEGKALLAQLLEAAVRPDCCYVHKWQEGDLVIWDNYGTLHRATPYDPNSGRIMHRTTVAGTELLH